MGTGTEVVRRWRVAPDRQSKQSVLMPKRQKQRLTAEAKQEGKRFLQPNCWWSRWCSSCLTKLRANACTGVGARGCIGAGQETLRTPPLHTPCPPSPHKNRLMTSCAPHTAEQLP